MLLDTLDDPIAIFQSASRLDSVVFLTEMKEKDDNVLVAIAMRQRKGSSSLTIDKITSVYGKEKPSAIQQWIDKGLLLYANKKKTASLPRIRRLQLPEERLEGVESSYLTEEDLVKYRDNVAQRNNSVKFSTPNLSTVNYAETREGKIHGGNGAHGDRKTAKCSFCGAKRGLRLRGFVASCETYLRRRGIMSGARQMPRRNPT